MSNRVACRLWLARIFRVLNRRAIWPRPVMLISALILTAEPGEATVSLLDQADLFTLDAYLRVDAGFHVLSDVDRAAYEGGHGTTTLLQGGGNDWATSLYGLDAGWRLDPAWTLIAKLEGGFDSIALSFNGGTDSIVNALFNRRAYIGVSSARWGSLVAGRDLFISNDLYNFDPMQQQNLGSETLVQGRNWPGAGQMVEYRSPDLAGWHLGAQVSVLGPHGTAPDSEAGLSLHDTIGAVDLWGVYDEVRDRTGKFTGLFTASIEEVVGASWRLAPLTLYLAVDHLAAAAAVGPRSAVQTWIGAAVPLDEAITLRTAWYRIAIDGGGGADLFALGATWRLASWLQIYTTLGTVANNGPADFTLDIYSPPPLPGHAQTGFYSGITLSF